MGGGPRPRQLWAVGVSLAAYDGGVEFRSRLVACGDVAASQLSLQLAQVVVELLAAKDDVGTAEQVGREDEQRQTSEELPY